MSEIPEVLPEDIHNSKLISNVHPGDWVNPEPKKLYNLLVIGAGTAGLVSAAGAAGLGAKVALVEKHLLGGDCLNYGCVPSKCLIRSSRTVAEIQNADNFGVRVRGKAEADFAAVMERMQRLRAGISHHDSAKRFKELGIDVFLGEGKFTSHETLEVEGKTLSFKKAIIATGARAFHPPIRGLAETGFLTNETLFSLTERPERFLVIGGGPLGCEMAQTFHRLGSRVTIVDKAKHLLIREDADAAEILQNSFIRDGICLILECQINKVEKRDGEKIVQLKCNGEDKAIAVDEILVGAGRVPNVDGLNPEAAGVEYDSRAGVIVDDHLQTTNRRIYAAGDICMKYKFTHAADAAARIAIQNALFLGRKKLSALTIPWCTYTDPEIAHVGMYKKDAQEAGIETETYIKYLNEVDRAITDGEEEGFVKIHVKEGSDKIIGATVVAKHAGEMISEITLAMVGDIGLKTISNVIHPYPTQAEAIRQVADEYNRSRLTPLIKKMLKGWLGRGL
jgi:pyruvate/2-oxoglutarate dehydrogenase complex dihydrolipoamide dehydrogenase (E3) component